MTKVTKSETPSTIEGKVSQPLLNVFLELVGSNNSLAETNAVAFYRACIDLKVTARDRKATVTEGGQSALFGVTPASTQHAEAIIEIFDTIEGAKDFGILKLATLAQRGVKAFKVEGISEAIKGHTVQELAIGDEAQNIAPIFPPSNTPKPRAPKEGLEFKQLLNLVKVEVQTRKKSLKTNKGALLLDEEEKIALIEVLEALAEMARANAIVKKVA